MSPHDHVRTLLQVVSAFPLVLHAGASLAPGLHGGQRAVHVVHFFSHIEGPFFFCFESPSFRFEGFPRLRAQLPELGPAVLLPWHIVRHMCALAHLRFVDPRWVVVARPATAEDHVLCPAGRRQALPREGREVRLELRHVTALELSLRLWNLFEAPCPGVTFHERDVFHGSKGLLWLRNHSVRRHRLVDFFKDVVQLVPARELARAVSAIVLPGSEQMELFGAFHLGHEPLPEVVPAALALACHRHAALEA
mmetsp:Transcript_23974/g.66647  ORF Transcript_23974/g.66647 Transcript_23974/m.66647 type:complete len:251 (-) Transcript_23974:301-1053(-)